jgi:hypothetical protein
MRRATLLVSIFLLAISALSLIGLLGVESLRFATRGAFDDDVLLDIMEEAYLAQSIFIGVGVITNICSIVGAIQYNSCLVGINIAWLVINWIATVVIEVMAYNEIKESYAGSGIIRKPTISLLFGACVTGFFIYPMASFIVEVRKGIMSRETHVGEKKYAWIMDSHSMRI